MPPSNRALQVLADALRQRRSAMGSRWRRLPVAEQALLVLAHLNKGETYTLWPVAAWLLAYASAETRRAYARTARNWLPRSRSGPARCRPQPRRPAWAEPAVVVW